MDGTYEILEQKILEQTDAGKHLWNMDKLDDQRVRKLLAFLKALRTICPTSLNNIVILADILTVLF